MWTWVPRLLLAAALASGLARSTSFAAAEPAALTFSPWTKTCIADRCFVGIDGRTAPSCSPLVAAVLAQSGDKWILRVTAAGASDGVRGLRVGTDRDALVEWPHARCKGRVCIADHEAATGLIDRLKRGHMLIVEVIGAAGTPTLWQIPLAGFAAAYEGPPQPLPLFKPEPGRLAKELEAARQGQQRAAASPCDDK